MISKEKLNFDPTDADTLAASDSVGAHLRAGTDGTLIGHVSDALKVNFSNTSIAVTATDLDIRDLDFATDSVDVSNSTNVAVVDGGGSLTVDATNLDIRDLTFATDKVDASGSTVELGATTLAALESITVSATDLDIRDLAFATDKVDVSGSSNVAVTDGGGSLTVDAVNLDIRDLAFATDKVDVTGSSVSISGTVAVTQSTSPWVIGDGGGSITVDATDLDIRDLAAATDSVSAWTKDGSGNAITSTTGWLDVNIAGSDIEINVEDDKANTALLTTQKDVSTTAAILASQLSARRFLWFQNLGNKNVFIGNTGVTNATGIRMSPGSIGEFRFGPALSLHAVSADGSAQDCRILQAS